jgi:hypothetical protein
VRSAFFIRLSCSSGGSALRCRDTIFVNRSENLLALIRWRFFDIFNPTLAQLWVPVTLSYTMPILDYVAFHFAINRSMDLFCGSGALSFRSLSSPSPGQGTLWQKKRTV